MVVDYDKMKILFGFYIFFWVYIFCCLSAFYSTATRCTNSDVQIQYKFKCTNLNIQIQKQIIFLVFLNLSLSAFYCSVVEYLVVRMCACIRDMTWSYAMWLSHMWYDDTMWGDSVKCDVTQSYGRGDSVKRFVVRMCACIFDMTQSYVTWLSLTWLSEVTQTYLYVRSPYMWGDMCVHLWTCACTCDTWGDSDVTSEVTRTCLYITSLYMWGDMCVRMWYAKITLMWPAYGLTHI